jgi:hypothetical protein
VRGAATGFSFLLFGPEGDIHWAIANIFGTWGIPQHKSLNMLPSPKIEACFVM